MGRYKRDIGTTLLMQRKHLPFKKDISGRYVIIFNSEPLKVLIIDAKKIDKTITQTKRRCRRE